MAMVRKATPKATTFSCRKRIDLKYGFYPSKVNILYEILPENLNADRKDDSFYLSRNFFVSSVNPGPWQGNRISASLFKRSVL
jgi:hypothetical protein